MDSQQSQLNILYPPQVDTFMPSFCYNESAKVWFNISSYDKDKINNIKYIHVSMVDQRNNINVFAGLDSNNVTVYPQYYPIKFSDVTYDSTKKMYWLTIPPQILKGNIPLENGQTAVYNTGQYYKVQLRFDLTESSDGDPTEFFKIENDQVIADALGLASYTNSNEDNFSEWSTGTLLKPIFIPKLELNKFKTEEEITNIGEIVSITPSTDELIVGSLTFKDIDNNEMKEKETEQLSWYQIKISGDNFDSGKIYTDINTPNQINYRADFSILETDNNYTMQIIYETNNGYFEINEYPIRIVNYSNNTEFSYALSKDENKGIIILNIIAPVENSPSDGFLIIRRSSHRSNFKKWDLIANYNISSQFNKTLIDNTIESMTGYRYQIQYMTENNILYGPMQTEISCCDFYGGLFWDGKKTLNISFNFQPSNRVNAMNRSKVDTLGGRYPLFTQNSKLKYHTYNITGRISTEDNGELFLPKEEVFGSIEDESSYYNYRYGSSADQPHTAECQGIKPSQDWLYEREYRDAVEEWLNNGKPKLFRSMTEGNMIVMLDAVTMTPDVALGRRLYDFSATMYEIGDGKDLNSLISFGLFEIIKE